MQAEFDSESERETARLRAMMTVRATEDAYWNLVGSWRSYEVVLGAQRLAEQQLALTRRQIAAGYRPTPISSTSRARSPSGSLRWCVRRPRSRPPLIFCAAC